MTMLIDMIIEIELIKLLVLIDGVNVIEVITNDDDDVSWNGCRDRLYHFITLVVSLVTINVIEIITKLSSVDVVVLCPTC